MSWFRNIFPKNIFKSDVPDFPRLSTSSLDYRDDLIERGYGFFSDWENTNISSGGKVYAEFTTPANAYMALVFRLVVTDKERIFYRVYSDWSSGGTTTTIPINKLKPSSSIVTGSSFSVANVPVSINSSSKVTNVPVFGEVNAGNRASGEFSSDVVFRLLPTSTSFLLELENASASSAYTQVTLSWFEIPQDHITDGFN